MLAKALEADMIEAAEAMDFESAALLRDQMKHVQQLIEQHETDQTEKEKRTFFHVVMCCN